MTCKCCGGNGWEGSNCCEFEKRYDQLWLEYHELVRRDENKQRVIADLVEEIEKLKQKAALDYPAIVT